MLRKWHIPLDSACLVFEVMEDSEESEDLVDWDGSCSFAEEEKPLVSEELDEEKWWSWRSCFISQKMFCRVSQGGQLGHNINAEGARPDTKMHPIRILGNGKEGVGGDGGERNNLTLNK